ncbi:MAG: HAMP domain-containing histidine kinase [Pirellulales bacterium]|nr:HAMP domain-containing histidine kinase [Pirellulales bacterium]
MTEADLFDERLQRAKLDALKELAYGASHEINNPLANISARAQTLLRDERDPERRRALETIHQQALRAHEMISDLMLFARPPRLDRRPADIAELAERIVAEHRDECQRREIDLAWSAGDALPAVDCDPVQIAVALKALCQNAIDAIGRVGKVELRGLIAREPVGSSAVERLRLEVTDNGPGVAAAARPHVFDPFYSGREAGRGLGFGLSKAWRIIEQHGGELRLDAGAEAGARFIMELPLSAPPS